MIWRNVNLFSEKILGLKCGEIRSCDECSRYGRLHKTGENFYTCLSSCKTNFGIKDLDAKECIPCPENCK